MGYGFRTLSVVGLRAEAEKLSKLVIADYRPTLVIGIRTGGFFLATLVPWPADAVLLPLTCRRPGTTIKQQYPAIKKLLALLPYGVLNKLRLCEHLLRHHLRIKKKSPRNFTADTDELAVIKAELTRQGSSAKILIVDDSVDSGITLRTVYETIRNLVETSQSIKSVAITVTTENPLMQPDFYLYKNILFRFPWSLDFKPAGTVWMELPQMRATTSVFVIDLDETLLSKNSFRYWSLYLAVGFFAGLSVRMRMTLTFNTVMAFLQRKLLLSSHVDFKQKLQKLWFQALVCDQQKWGLRMFIASLNKKIRPHFRELLAYIAQGKIDAILATAAAGDYAIPFGLQLGFRHVLATPFYTQEKEEYRENRGEEKCRRVLELINELSWNNKKIIFFTDHREDLPLMQKSAVIGWFGDEKEVGKLKKLAPDAKIIPCLQMSAEQMTQRFIG